MTSGYMLRRDQARADASASPCDACGHPHREHRELQPTYELRDGAIATIEHPDYEVGKFVCHVDGCTCVIRR